MPDSEPHGGFSWLSVTVQSHNAQRTATCGNQQSAALTVIGIQQKEQERIMNRERALKMVLVLVGLLFSALIYPLMMFVRQEPALAMMLSLYVTLGIFLLLASRNPSANRSLI